jgi:signal peptidase I
MSLMNSPAVTRHDERPRLGVAGWSVRVGSVALAFGLVALWHTVLRPVSLGGPAGYTIVAGKSMTPTLREGDLVVTRQQRSYALGDIVVYTVPAGEAGGGAQIVHRIVGGSSREGYMVQGDDRQGVDPWRPRPEDVIGKVRVVAPRAGEALLFLRTGLGLAILAGLATLLVTLAVAPTPAGPRASGNG